LQNEAMIFQVRQPGFRTLPALEHLHLNECKQGEEQLPPRSASSGLPDACISERSAAICEDCNKSILEEQV
jgi:hypothetical protein